MLKRLTLAASLASLPTLCAGEELSCSMFLLCLEASPCQEWDQIIQISGEDENWQVVWSDDLPSDYTQLADIPAPEGAIEPTRLRAFFLANEDTQAVQLVSLADTGDVVVTLHQPHIRPRSVTGFGLCAADGATADAEAEAAENE